jgi:pimeloyl-ACP methyl ester carboxylesterase
MKPPVLKGFAIVGITALLAISIGLYPRLFGRKRLRFTYLTGQLAEADYRALGSEPGWSTASVTVAPGIRLQGLVRRPNAANAPWVLYYPGNDATQLKRGQAFLSRLSAGADWGLAVFAYRGYDSSNGEPRVADLAADAPEIMLQLCKNESVEPGRVNVIGFSIGGYLAVRAVGEANKRGRRPATLSLMASVDDIVMVRRSFWQRLDAGDDFQTQPFLADVPAPVLVVQGGADETLGGPVQGQAIAKTLADRAQYVELPGVGHNVLIETEAAITAVHAFVAAHNKQLP